MYNVCFKTTSQNCPSTFKINPSNFVKGFISWYYALYVPQNYVCIPVLVLIVLLTERVGLWHVYATCLFAMSAKIPTNLNEDCVSFVSSSRQLTFLCTDVHTNTNQNLKCPNFDTPLPGYICMYMYKYRDLLSVRIVFKTFRINFFGTFLLS